MAADDDLFLGADGGGTRCRVCLALGSGAILGEGNAGPANLRFGAAEAFAAVLAGARQCLDAAGLSPAALDRVTACLALAGASDPTERAKAGEQRLPFRRTTIVTDAEAACIGAHAGGDGAVVIIGTGSIGLAIVGGRRHRVGGWGLPTSDEGGGAWLGLEVMRRVQWAHDRRLDWTPLLAEVFAHFKRDPYEIVRWTSRATPGNYSRFAPLVVEHAKRDDTVAVSLMRLAAGHIDALATRLVATEAMRIALMGGLATAIEPYLAAATRRYLVAPLGDALAGALRIAAGTAPSPAGA